MNAAHDRYNQILALIEERREAGRMLGIEGIDASCDEALSRLEALSAFASADAGGLEPMDRSVAKAALEALQRRHNAERAALAAMRERRCAPRAGDAAETPAAPRGFWRGLLKPRN